MRNESAWTKTRPIIYAILLHVLLGVVLFFSFNFSAIDPGVANAPPAPAINAVAVDDKQVMQEMLKLKQAEERKEAESKRKQEELEQTKKELDDLAKQKEVEREKIKQLEEVKKQEQQKAQEQKRVAEEKHQQEVALLKKKQEEEKKELERIQKEKEEAKQLAEKERKEQKAKEEKEKKAREKKEAAEKARVQREKELQEQMEAEAQAEREQAEAEHAAAVQRAGQEFLLAAANKVQQMFEEPQVGLDVQSCLLRVSVDPAGTVLNVELVESSGYELFDSAAQRAVFRASPLPIPQDPGLFDDLKTFRLRVYSQNAL